MRREQCEKANCEYLHGNYCHDLVDNEVDGEPIPLSAIWNCGIADETKQEGGDKP